MNIAISEYVDWENFKERFYRRNILIHNSGMPNAQYRKKQLIQERMSVYR